ncbi:MAG: PGPGW domain-containing protein [Desulfotignum sp.]|nr:PGPGW domain-containing protein [Desulfotignum sp.]
MNRVFEMVLQYPSVLAGITLVSVAGFIFSILAVSRLICWLPSNYFMVFDNPTPEARLFRPRVQIFKNLAGAVLICLGLVMLIVPGQGLLTLFLGLVIMNFPGKKRVIRFLIRLKTIQKSLNWMRRKKRRPPFLFPDTRKR